MVGRKLILSIKGMSSEKLPFPANLITMFQFEPCTVTGVTVVVPWEKEKKRCGDSVIYLTGSLPGPIAQW